jgi:tRNA threonylcarbamoyladenosine biosynthesis protein TsaB
MMLLAIDTATPQVGVALWDDHGPVASTRATEGRRHGELLAPAIEAVLRVSGRTTADLTAIAVDVGPGLFTGLRVGLATGKALAAGLRLPAIGVTSLEVVAHPHRRQGALVAAVVDARRREVFRAVYRTDSGRLLEVAAPAVCTPDALASELAALDADVLAVGDGARRYADVLTAAPTGAGRGPNRIEIGGPGDAHPDPQVLAEIAAARAAAGPPRAPHPDTDTHAALYLRQADVRIGWDSHEVAATPPIGASLRG